MQVGTPVSTYSPGALIREGGIPAAVALFNRIAATAYGAAKPAVIKVPAVLEECAAAVASPGSPEADGRSDSPER